MRFCEYAMSQPQFLGIEIGGTKLQVAIGADAGPPLTAVARGEVDPAGGAEGILAEIERLAHGLLADHPASAVGIGFGGPVDRAGRVVKSHHVHGWDGFQLTDWARERFGLPAVVANDADTAALAEARLGAGRGANPVFYITVGTGIGAGVVVDGRIYRGHGVSVAELGHLRPGLQAEGPDQILESYAAGWGIAAAAQSRLRDPMRYRLGELSANRRRPEDIRQRLIEIEEAGEADAGNLLDRCDGQPEHLSTKLVVEAAADGNGIAAEILRQAWQALGWGIAQAITLLSPEVVVIGGGVSLAGRELFFEPLEREVARYVFPPLLDSYRIVPASLGEEVVLHGALLLAQELPR